jgi:hypothetical protein
MNWCSAPITVDRDGFQFLIAQVGLGQAGAVLTLEASRLARCWAAPGSGQANRPRP